MARAQGQHGQEVLKNFMARAQGGFNSCPRRSWQGPPKALVGKPKGASKGTWKFFKGNLEFLAMSHRGARKGAFRVLKATKKGARWC